MRADKSASRPAFTLIELLVVIAIIGILASLLLPSLNRARDMARRIQCAGNMRQMFLVAMNYAEDNDGWGIPGIRLDTSCMLTASISAISSYWGRRDIFVCPGTSREYLHRSYGGAMAANGVGEYSSTLFKTSYHLAFATQSDPYVQYFGWLTYAQTSSSSVISAPDNSYGSPVPNFRALGRELVCPTPTLVPRDLKRYIFPAEQQPAFIDGFVPDNQPLHNVSTRDTAIGERWISRTIGVPNNHRLLRGRNIVYMDGHTSWLPDRGTAETFRYRSGWEIFY